MDECKWSYARDGKHREFILPGPFNKAAGKKVCQDCCRFLGWHEEKTLDIPPPAPKSPQTEQEKNDVFLLKSGELPEWEKKFVTDLSGKNEWTSKQRAVFERIRDQYLKTNEPAQQKEKNETTSKPTATDIDDFYVPF